MYVNIGHLENSCHLKISSGDPFIQSWQSLSDPMQHLCFYYKVIDFCSLQCPPCAFLWILRCQPYWKWPPSWNFNWLRFCVFITSMFESINTNIYALIIMYLIFAHSIVQNMFFSNTDISAILKMAAILDFQVTYGF